MVIDKEKTLCRSKVSRNIKTPLKIQLYNLKTDIAETKDVAAGNPKIVAQIRQLMKTERTPSADFPFKPID